MDYFEKIILSIVSGIIGGLITTFFMQGSIGENGIGLILGSAFVVFIINKVANKRKRGETVWIKKY